MTKLDTEIACVQREIRQRERVYPRRVQDGRMTQAQADHELGTMGAVLARLQATRDPEKLL